MEYNEKLRELRIQNNMPQEHLAEQLHVTKQTVSKWEQGINQLDIYTLKQHSQIFSVSIDELVGAKIQAKQRESKTRVACNVLFICSAGNNADLS